MKRVCFGTGKPIGCLGCRLVSCRALRRSQFICSGLQCRLELRLLLGKCGGRRLQGPVLGRLALGV